jgi:hypothetical protein
MTAMTVAQTAVPTATHSEVVMESTNTLRAADAISVPFGPKTKERGTQRIDRTTGRDARR